MTEVGGPALGRPHARGTWPAVAVATALSVHLALTVQGARGDLDVYRWGAQTVWGGGLLYAGTDPLHHLAFTYPPFAAVAFSPLLALPSGLVHAWWPTLGLVALARTCVVLVRATGSARAAVLRDAAVVLALCTFAEPVASGLGYGQVNLLLLWLVVEDLLGLGATRRPGYATGVAGGIKVTPLLLGVHLALVGRRREAVRVAVGFAVTVVVAAAVAPRASWTYWTDALWQPDRTGGLQYSNNQSVAALLTRLWHGPLPGALWLAVSAAAAVVALLAARRAHRAGNPVLGLGTAVLGMLLASPVSWTHHWVWAVVPAVALWRTGALVARVLVGVLFAITATPTVYQPLHRGYADLDWPTWLQPAGNAYVLWGLLAVAWVGLARALSRPPAARPTPSPPRARPAEPGSRTP
jgi:alpha-1,2-mannosyltransferase